MYAAVRIYQVDPGSVEEFKRLVNETFLPIIKEASGSRPTTRWTQGTAGSPR